MNLIGLKDIESRTLPYLLRTQADQIGDDTWLIFDDKHYTFGTTNQLANDYAAGFRARGVSPGDLVAVFMENSIEFVAVTAALSKVGAPFVPINTAYKGEYLRHVLADSRASLVVIDAGLLPRLLDVVPQLPHLRRVVVRGTAAPASTRGLVVEPIESLPLTGSPEFDSRVSFRDTMAILYTSGTTGRSKGCILSQHYWCVTTQSTVRARRVVETDRFYSVTPMFHAAAWWYCLHAGLLTGRPVGVDTRFSVSQFWSRVRKYRATQIMTLGAMHSFLWALPETDEDADNPARVWVALPLAAELWEPFKKRYEVEHLCFGYGQTEANPIVQEIATKPGSCGKPQPHFDVRILDDDDHEVARGEVGEICVRPLEPYTMFNGYYNNPAATLEVSRNLWHHTGDLGRMDEDGDLFYVDRKQDFLRRRGENVSSYEVETIISRHQDVAAVAAHAVPSEHGEDEIKVCVVLRPGASCRPEELARFCAEHLPYFCVPRYIEFVDDLPATPSGKVQKYLLRERGVTDRTWDAQSAGFTASR